MQYADGFRYLLTCVDCFTRWPEAIPLVDIRAKVVADAFFSGWIARFGTPATITTNRGAQFKSKLWDGLCNQFGIVRNPTMSYHPQLNGMVERFHRQLIAAIMAHESPTPPTQLRTTFSNIRKSTHAFLRRIAIAPPLTAPYDGPYKVSVRSGRVMKILVEGKVETVSLNRVKPAHLDNEPTIGTEKQRKTQTNTKNSQNTATIRREPAFKQNSEKKRAEPKVKTQTRSVAVQHGTNSATTSQNNANRVNLPQQFTPYVAPHSRIPAISRANGSDGGLRTYSRIPLHLRVKTPNTNETIKPPNVQNNSYTAKGDQIVPDATVKQTRVGRKIQTPARFVQMVHALVAPNNIYCRTSCTSRNNHNL